MSGLEKSTQDDSARKYIAETREEAGLQAQYHTQHAEEERIIDEDTERTIVSVISAIIAATPLIVMAGKLLPDIPIYSFCRYIPLYNMPF